VIRRSEIVFVLLSLAPFSGAMAQVSQVENGIQGPSSIKKNYPGGRDDSDLAVQPQRRITKKETETRSDEIDEGDYDQGDAASGFGE
jgi:hypothetical protein